MKKTNAPLNAAAMLAATVLVLAASAPKASAQDHTMSISELVHQGFTSVPYAGCSVTGVQGFDPFQLREVYENSAHNGNIYIYGLNFLVTSARVESGKLLVSGKLQLAQPIPLPGTDKKTISAEAATLQFDANGFASIVGGTIGFDPNLKIGSKLTLSQLSAIIEPADQKFGGTATLDLDEVSFGVGLVLKNSNLDSLSVNVGRGTPLRKPLGTTGAFLDVIDGTFGFKDDLWYVSAGMVIHVGYPVGGRYLVTMDANGTITGAWCVEINGGAEIFDIPVAAAHFLYTPPYDVSINSYVDFFDIYLSECNFELQGGDFSGGAKGRLQIPPYIPMVGGWQMANTLAAIDNNGLQGSFDINVSPEIPAIDVPGYCPPRLPYWVYRRWSGFRKRWWQPPCTPGFTIPGIPPVTAHVGFKFRSGDFSWDEVADDKVEAWELSYRHVITDVDTGNRMWFMSNYARRDKVSTGSKGRPFTKDGSGNPTATFTVPEGEQNVIFRLTYQNTNTTVAMGLHLPNGDILDVNGGPLPNGYPTNEIDSVGSYAEVVIRSDSNSNSVSFGEAYFSLPKPKAGSYTAVIYNDKALGNFALEHLRQNIPPSVSLNSAGYDGTDTNSVLVDYTATITEGTPSTRIFFCKLGDDGENKAGPRYLVDEFPSTTGTHTNTVSCLSTNMPSGLYRVAVTIDDPYSRAAEVISSEEFFVDNPLVPEPVTEIAALAQDKRFNIAWTPSPSTNVASYIIRYTKSQQPADFEYQKAVSFTANFATVDGLENGQPYLVTVVAVSAEGYQSQIGPVTRVVPTEGFGLSLPSMFSPRDQVAIVGSEYIYRPQLYLADIDKLQVLAQQYGLYNNITYIVDLATNYFSSGVSSPMTIPISDFTVFGTHYSPYEITNLVETLYITFPFHWDLIGSPDGMTIGANGMVRWTPSDTDIGDHNVTIRASLTNELAEMTDSDLSVLQTFPLTVVEAKYKNTSGIKVEPQNLFFTPITRADEGEIYVYLPSDSTNHSISVIEGPGGMTNISIPDPRTIQIEEVGLDYIFTFDTLDLIYWKVPFGAVTNQRVRLRAAPRGIVDPEENVCVYQDYYLTVAPQYNALGVALPKPLEIYELDFSPEGAGMVWWGTHTTFSIMRSEDLEVWEEIGTFPAHSNRLYSLGYRSYPLGLGIFLDTNPPPEKAFYRIEGYNEEF